MTNPKVTIRRARNEDINSLTLLLKVLFAIEEDFDFNDAVRRARNYVTDSFIAHHDDLVRRPTFLFCANDNMATGTRMALTNLTPKKLGVSSDQLNEILGRSRIICFDASTFVRMYVDLKDRFLWRAVDQRHTTIVYEAIKCASAILRGQIGGWESRILVKPKIYQR